MAFRDRREAGAALAALLTAYTDRPDVIALGLVRGGVPVAAEIAARLHVPLDALVVRKLGVPWAPEVAFGAIGPGGIQVLNPEIRLEPHDMAPVLRHETAELRRRDRLFRLGRSPLDLTGRVALIIDDGLATGATAAAAVAVARALSATRIVLAAPVGATPAAQRLTHDADEVVCPVTSDQFGAVSCYYDDFHQVPDAEVAHLLSTLP